jgi:hypothetical protein
MGILEDLWLDGMLVIARGYREEWGGIGWFGIAYRVNSTAVTSPMHLW